MTIMARALASWFFSVSAPRMARGARGRRGFVPGAIVCLALLAGPALASDPMAEARALIAAGEFPAARSLLAAWRPAEPGARERRLWALAVLARQAGDLGAARAHLSDLVALRPDVERFRLELAGVLGALGEGERATHQAAMAGARVSPQAAFDAEPVISRRLSLAIVPQTNPGRRTDSEVIEVLGLPFLLAPGSRAEPATGLRASGRLAWSPRLAEGWRARLSAGVSAEVFDRSVARELAASVEAALVRVTPGGLRLEAGLSYGRRWLDGRDFSRGPGLSLAFSRPLGTQGQLSGAASVQWLRHPAAPAADGPRAVGVLAYSRRLSPQTTMRGSLRLERTDAAAASLSFRATEVGVGMTHVFRGGLSVGIDVLQRQARHDGGTALFPQARSDDRTTLRLRMLHGQVAWRGFAPVIEIEAARQRSNVPVNDYRNLGVSLGLTRSF